MSSSAPRPSNRLQGTGCPAEVEESLLILDSTVVSRGIFHAIVINLSTKVSSGRMGAAMADAL